MGEEDGAAREPLAPPPACSTRSLVCSLAVSATDRRRRRRRRTRAEPAAAARPQPFAAAGSDLRDGDDITAACASVAVCLLPAVTCSDPSPCRRLALVPDDMAASVRTPLQTVHESVVSDVPKSKSSYAKPQDSVTLSAAAAASSGRSSQSRRSADEPHIGRYRLLKTIGKGNFAKVSPACRMPR